MKKFGVPGVSVAVIWNYQIHWAKGYGVADVQTGAPVNPETVFQAASISKPVAAMGVLKAVQDGVFGLEDDINGILTSWRLNGGEFTRNTPVTPRTLTSHVSGLGDAFGFPGYDPGVTLPTAVQILQGHSLSNVGPVFMEREPWAAFEYSGGGVTVMQVALSDARRRAFADVMRTDVLEPIGMTQSTFEQPLPPARDRNAARAHDGTGQPMGPKWHAYPELAAAGLWTTPTDLARFAIEVQQAAHGKSNRVLSRATAQEMLTPVGVGSFAVGFSMVKEGEGWYFTHGGANWGFRADLRAHKVKGYGLAIMTNADRGGAVMAEITRRVKRAYGWDSETKPPPRGYDPPITTAPVTVPPSVLAEYVGTYRGPGFTFVVTLDGAALRVGEGGPQTMPLLAASEASFFTQSGLRVTFTRDGAGKVNGLTIRLSGRDVPIPRVEPRS
jgi:CubicO group peptidase (beta-lactamase class C family)